MPISPPVAANGTCSLLGLVRLGICLALGLLAGGTVRAGHDPALRPPPVNTAPGLKYADGTRIFQGIPGIERAANGRLWALWYAGGPDEPSEGPGNYVVLVTSADDGRTWSTPRLVIDPPGMVRAYDPCLWHDAQGRLWLFWAQSYGWWDGRSGVWAITTEQSANDQPRWSAPRRLTDGIMMNKPTMLTTGGWLLPAAVWECQATASIDPAHRHDLGAERGAHCVLSTDRGATWTKLGQAVVPQRVFDEHMIVERRDGSLWMLVRTAYGIGESTSTDRGKTWSPGRPSGIPHVNSRFFIRRLKSGKLLLVTHNPPDKKTRSHLVARLSDDDGRSWHGGLMIDERPGVSYPDGVESPDGTVYLIYDFMRTRDKQILIAAFTASDVAAGKWASKVARQRVVVNQATGVRPQRSKAVAAPAADLDRLRKLRREAAHRLRRMIFNNDGDDVIYTKKAPTAEALLALRTSPLVGSQVDSIFYSNSMCFGDALHASRVMQPFVSTEYIFKDNGLAQLLERGIDPIRVMVDFGHQHGIEVFWDMRMNDTHDAGLSGYGPYLLTKLKRDHPEYLVGTPQKQPKYGTWSSVNYAVPEIRELCYRFFEEVCQRFDVDGVELDFFRHACFFKSVADGGRASRAELDMMTELVRRIRHMTEREGLRRGRPILVAIRAPDSVEFCQAIGIDLEKWLAEGWADMLIGTCYFQCNPWEYLVELGHRYGLPVYPSLSESRVLGETRLRRQSIESYRARAMRAWAAGGDGIYVFNSFDPRAALWRELGDPVALRTKDKLYFVTVRNGDPQRYLAGARQDRHVPILTPSEPWPIPSDKPSETELLIGDDLAGAQQAGLKPRVTCHIQATSPRLEVSLNGTRLEKPVVKGDWLDFAVPPGLVKKGANRLAFRAPPEQPLPADQWTAVWEGSRLPTHPWTKMGFASDCVAELQGGALLLADRGKSPGSYAYYQNLCAVRPEDQVVVEARMKLLSGWSSLIVASGVAGEEIQILADAVKIRQGGPAYRMSTTDAFHTYRITIHRKDLQVYVDGQLRLDLTGRFTRPAPGGRSGVAFGGANSPGVGEALWQSVKVRNSAVSLLDAALRIEYPRSPGTCK